MSTALVLSLRESCGYLRDDGYHQTAQLMAMAAEEIERLNRQLASVTEAQRPAPTTHGTVRRAFGSIRSGTARRLAGPHELGT